jgi:enediyne biosynthesis protein E4
MKGAAAHAIRRAAMRPAASRASLQGLSFVLLLASMAGGSVVAQDRPGPKPASGVAMAVAPAAPVPRPAVPRFIDETESAALRSRFEGEEEYLVGGGVAVFDCDGDGLPEMYVTAGVNKAQLLRNRSQRGGPLKLVEERSGLELTNALGAYPIDIDGDGKADLVVLRVGEVQVFRGLGDCKFERANAAWNVQSGNLWHTALAATWEKGQRWPTLALGTYTDRTRPEFPWGSCTPGALLRPRAVGNGFAAPLPLTPGHCALSMMFTDWNRSGTPSLRVSNDREYYKGGQEQLWHVRAGEAPRLYTAAEGWKPLQIWGMGIASHDLDGDGLPEYYLTSMSDQKLQTLAAGKAQPSYVDVAFKRGATAHRPYAGGDIHPSTGWHAQFADVNNDGRADLFVAKGNVGRMPDFATLDPNNLMLQTADGNFLEAGAEAGVASYKRGRGAMLADLNGDGLLDLVVVNRWDRAELWRNVGAGDAQAPAPMGHWVQVRLSQPGANRYAIGAWVELDLGGRIIRQEVVVGGGHASGQLGWLHFGLGEARQVKLRIQWPQGDWSAWAALEADRFYTFDAQKGAQPWTAP